MAAPRVSVIIPVYNTERYLAECLGSALSQTLDDIEIVCVNDGSTDSSGDILREYARKDPRVRIIEQENQGLSGARNAGASAARGDYLHFLDADDFIDHETMEELHEQASRDELDVLYFDAVPFFEDSALEEEHSSYKSYYQRQGEYAGVSSGEDLLARMALNGDYRVSACLQLTKREYYSAVGLSFYPGLLHEDNLFSFKCVLQADRVGYLPRPYYHRRIRADSIMTAEKGLANFKGYFISYLEMLRFAIPREFDERTSIVIAKLCDLMYQQALKILRELPVQNDAIRQLDPSPEALLTCTSMIRQRDEARRLRNELKASKDKLRAIRSSKSYRAARFLRKLLAFGK